MRGENGALAGFFCDAHDTAAGDADEQLAVIRRESDARAEAAQVRDRFYFAGRIDAIDLPPFAAGPKDAVAIERTAFGMIEPAGKDSKTIGWDFGTHRQACKNTGTDNPLNAKISASSMAPVILTFLTGWNCLLLCYNLVMPKLDYRNIEKDPARCGGQPVVAGTRIRVATVLTCYRQGMRVEEIIQHYSNLKPSDVHDALAYAYDHLDEIETDLADDDEAQVKARHKPPT
jgi:uncharacterized protein (DUF433 family)